MKPLPVGRSKPAAEAAKRKQDDHPPTMATLAPGSSRTSAWTRESASALVPSEKRPRVDKVTMHGMSPIPSESSWQSGFRSDVSRTSTSSRRQEIEKREYEEQILALRARNLV